MRRLLAAALLVAVAGLGGCRTTRSQSVVGKPAEHTIESGPLVVKTNFELPRDHVLIRDLEKMRDVVTETLELPPPRKKVVVYIFANESQYRRFMHVAYPRLPPRRAYFIGTPRELAVYTFWGHRIQEDLRHEFTHGLLHASLGEVPLWIDEGLAEYFEVPGPTVGGVNHGYVSRLSSAVDNGWQPNVERLEELESVRQMQALDYQEAWAWAHFLLHGGPESKRLLVEYLADVRSVGKARPLSARLRTDLPDAEVRLLNYLSSLGGGRSWAGAEDPLPHVH